MELLLEFIVRVFNFVELGAVEHEPVLKFADVLLDFLELFFLHDKLVGDKGDIISALVLLHDGEHGLEFLPELFVIFRDFEFFLVVMNHDPDSLLDERNTIGHVDVVFLSMLTCMGQFRCLLLNIGESY